MLRDVTMVLKEKENSSLKKKTERKYGPMFPLNADRRETKIL
jgi:hypothetical protein